MAKEKADPRRNGETAANGTTATLQFEPFLNAGNKMFEAWRAIGTELMEFGAARFQRGIETSRAIAQCSNLGEAMELQANFARSTVHDLFGTAGKLAELSTRPMLDVLAATQKTARDGASAAEAAE